MITRRLVAAAVLGALAVTAVAGCRSQPTVAAYVGDKTYDTAKVEQIYDEARTSHAASASPGPTATPSARPEAPVSRQQIVAALVGRDLAAAVVAEKGLTKAQIDLAVLALECGITNVVTLQFAEDQNFIHKSFAVLEDENMLLVPHTGWEYEGEGYECSGTYKSGVQIIDWLNDDLTLRGLVPSQGRVRRAFTVWSASVDRIERHLRLVGLRRAARPAPTLADVMAAEADQ